MRKNVTAKRNNYTNPSFSDAFLYLFLTFEISEIQLKFLYIKFFFKDNFDIILNFRQYKRDNALKNLNYYILIWPKAKIILIHFSSQLLFCNYFQLLKCLKLNKFFFLIKLCFKDNIGIILDFLQYKIDNILKT